MGLVHSQGNENVEMAREMLELGLDIDQICQITKLSKEEVEKLAENC